VAAEHAAPGRRAAGGRGTARDPGLGCLDGVVHGAVPAGVGVGWRPEIAGVVSARAGLGFCEVIAEGLDPRSLPLPLLQLRRRGVAVVPHGVRLSLGGAEPVDPARVDRLAACAAALGAPLVSEHIAFVRAGGREAGHLLAVPRSRAALDALATNLARLQAELDVPVALEPIAALFDWPDDEYSEGDFLRALLDRTGAQLLLDVANVHANAVNRGRDPRAALDALPLDRIGYVHVAGGSVPAGDRLRLYHDTHTDPVPTAVLDLLTALCERLPAAPPVLLERDGCYPPAAQLHAELDAVAAAVRRGRAARPGGAPGTAPVTAPVTASGTGPGPPGPDTRSHRRAGGPAGLARGQAELLDALVADGPDPAGFDPEHLDATRRALLRKRVGEVARAWPLLVDSLGPDHLAAVSAHLAGRPCAGGLRDGWDLARWLRGRGALSPGAAAELAGREAAYGYDGTGAPRPRGRLARHVRNRLRAAGPGRADRA